MSEQQKDWADEKAEELLPCAISCWSPPSGSLVHVAHCPYEYRKRVAAALREMKPTQKENEAIDIAREWVKQSHEKWYGPMGVWSRDQLESYHRDLGMLVTFVIDCWPKTNKE